MNPLTATVSAARPNRAASSEPMGLRSLGYGLLGVALILGALLRWRCWAPVTSDEVAIIKPFSAMTYHFFTDQEAARNPPLFSLLFSFLEVPSRIATAGRLFSATCSLMAAVPAFIAGRVLSRGSSLAGALAATMVALNPPLAMEGVTFRAYGSFALVESARLALLCVLLEAPDQKTLLRTRSGFVWLTALLPWIHYAAFPILTLEAALLLLFVRPARALLEAHVIAAITSVPLVWMILSSDNRPEATGNALDWASRFWLGGAFRLGGGPFRQGGDPWVTVAVLAPLVLAGTMFARAPSTRAMLAHSLAVLGAAWWISAHVFVRPAVAALGAPSLGIWLVALAYAIPGWFARIALLSVAVVFATGYPTLFHPNGQPNYIPLSPARAMAAFAHDALQSAQPTTWHVFHGWDMTVLGFHFKAEGAEVHSCVVSAPDGSQLGCIEVGANRFIEVKDIDQAPSGKLVTFGCDNRVTRCPLVGGEPCALIYECP